MLVLSVILLLNVALSWGESACKAPNTGTVLFRNIDVLRKHCWSKEELALLYMRRAMMELIPRQIPHNIPLILEYMHLTLHTLREHATSAPVYKFMFAALADTFGGYLQGYGLPLLHEAYYEGYVSYDNAAELYRLQSDFKEALMSDGGGWTRPMEVRKHINRILPLKMPSTRGSKPCNLLLTDTSGQKSNTEDSSGDNQLNSLIPLPILDDNKHPSSVAIPFKSRAMYNLKSRSSYDILIKYYIEASRCIAKSQKNGIEQSEFDHVFSNWLKAKIVPRLKDEAWYVGFSNVLRIEETIQQREGMIAAGQRKDKDDDSLFSPEFDRDILMNSKFVIMMVLIIILTILFVCCLYWTLIRNCVMCCGQVDVESEGDASDNTSLLSGSEDYTDSSKGRGKGKVCKHGHKTNSNVSEGPVSEPSRLNLSCGLGKGFGCSRSRHQHQ